MSEWEVGITGASHPYTVTWTGVRIEAETDTNYQKAKELGLEKEATDKFLYWGYEVEVEVELDTKTGKWKNLRFKDENNDNFTPE